jgi:hypothetical protein
MGEEFGCRIWIPNERKIVLNRDVIFKPEVVCNLRNDITKPESMCPTFQLATTKKMQVLQNNKVMTEKLRLIPEEVIVRIRKGMFKTGPPLWSSGQSFWLQI